MTAENAALQVDLPEHPDCTSQACLELAQDLSAFITASPTAFHTAAEVARRLESAGFSRLREDGAWELAPGNRHYVLRNNSSLIAFKVGSDVKEPRFMVCAAHGDSPALRIKATPELAGPGSYLRLNVEPYGGMIDRTWLDRPLGIAGRVLVRTGSTVASHLVNFDKDVAWIPNVAAHLDRGARARTQLGRAIDLFPLLSAGVLEAGSLTKALAEHVGVDESAIIGADLFAINRDVPRVWGLADEFISSPRLDDLQCAHAGCTAFIDAEECGATQVFALFDNEEVGSLTKQGASSTFMREVLERLAATTLDSHATPQQQAEVLPRALARSMMVSFDGAHALHPNHPELHDVENSCALNGGLVIKEAASQKYCTDGFARATLVAVLDAAGLPHQRYANRSDLPGGSTLGNLSNAQVSMHGVDVGLPQLAMHSACETAGVKDSWWGMAAIKAWYEADVRIDGASSVTFVAR